MSSQHHMAMKEIAEFYKYGHSQQNDQGTTSEARPRRAPQVPHLLTIHVWSDGQRSQYKGEKNFGRMSTWPKSVAVGGMEVQLHHYTYESHHASGPQVAVLKKPSVEPPPIFQHHNSLPQDNAGKDPRKAMDAAILHQKTETIYDYHRCMEWTTTNMQGSLPRPCSALKGHVFTERNVSVLLHARSLVAKGARGHMGLQRGIPLAGLFQRTGPTQGEISKYI